MNVSENTVLAASTNSVYVANNQARVWTLGAKSGQDPVVLTPGLNTVDASHWDAVKNLPLNAAVIKAGIVEEVSSPTADQLAMQKEFNERVAEEDQLNEKAQAIKAAAAKDGVELNLNDIKGTAPKKPAAGKKSANKKPAADDVLG